MVRLLALILLLLSTCEGRVVQVFTSASEDGWRLGDNWLQGDPWAILLSDSIAAFRFLDTLAGFTTGPGGQVLEPPLVESAELRVTFLAGGGAGSGPLHIYAWRMLRPHQEAFSSTNLPSTQDTLLLATHTPTSPTSTVEDIPLDVDGLNGIVRAADYRGDIGIMLTSEAATLGSAAVVQFSETGPGARARLTLNYSTIPFVTGISVNKPLLHEPQDVVARCPKSGRLMPREEMVPDGYLGGTLVCPEEWDPPDLPVKQLRGIKTGFTS